MQWFLGFVVAVVVAVGGHLVDTGAGTGTPKAPAVAVASSVDGCEQSACAQMREARAEECCCPVCRVVCRIFCKTTCPPAKGGRCEGPARCCR